MVLQPYVDAVVLSKLSNPEVVGYYAVARKLIGVLVLPASALIGALYPTLCRLHATSMPDFIAASNGSIRGTSLLALPVALGCFLYPDVGVAIYSKAAFGPAEDDLRMMALFLFLVYFTMPIGTAILASGRQRAWAIVQSLCVGVSLLCDPPFVTYFQRRTGNGGIGVCAAAVLSEIIVVACGLWMAPRGTFDRRTFRVLLSAAVAGALMAATAHLLRAVNSFVGAPVAVIVYAATVWFTGGIDPSFLYAVRRTIGKKVSRLRPSA